MRERGGEDSEEEEEKEKENDTVDGGNLAPP